jgi:hypothetical protein
MGAAAQTHTNTNASIGCRSCHNNNNNGHICTATRPHLRRDSATSAPRLGHICTATRPHLHRDSATSAPRLGHICTGTRPHLHRDSATSAPRLGHIRTGTRPCCWGLAGNLDDSKPTCVTSLSELVRAAAAAGNRPGGCMKPWHAAVACCIAASRRVGQAVTLRCNIGPPPGEAGRPRCVPRGASPSPARSVPAVAACNARRIGVRRAARATARAGACGD